MMKVQKSSNALEVKDAPAASPGEPAARPSGDPEKDKTPIKGGVAFGAKPKDCIYRR
jgi:hypothetical protein